MEHTEKLAFAQTLVRETSVSDGFALAGRYYAACIKAISEGDMEATRGYKMTMPLVPQMLHGIMYMHERAMAASETFLDEAQVQCCLEGKANVVDLVRGFRVLAANHPNTDAKELYSALASGVCIALESRVGIPVDVAPFFGSKDDVRGTLLIWYTLAQRASQIMRLVNKNETKGGLSVVSHANQQRARIIKDFALQSFAEMSVFIEAIG